MQITPNIAHQLAQASARPTSAGAAETGSAPSVPSDIVDIQRSSMTEDGKLKVIITGKNDGIYKSDPALEQKYGAVVTAKLDLINGVAAEITPSQLEKMLKDGKQDVNVYLDQKRTLLPIVSDEPGSRGPIDAKLNTAMPTLGVDKLWEQGYTGKGVTIAIVDTGIYPHPDFEGRIVGFRDEINQRTEAYDDQGHGTHVAGDAAGTGKASDGKFKGPAFDANLVGIKVLDENGSGYDSGIISGIQWMVENKDALNIRVFNMSLGGTIGSPYQEDPLAMAVEETVKKGVIACIAGGNEGPGKSTIGTPGNAPSAITVAAFDDRNTVDRADDKIARFSSRGPTSFDKLDKPDIMSPGVNITAPNSPGSQLDQEASIPHVGREYITISGTSMATPILAGIVANLVQANPGLTPEKMKEILMGTATPMANLGKWDQGAGVIEPPKALEKALEALPPTPPPEPAPTPEPPTEPTP